MPFDTLLGGRERSQAERTEARGERPDQDGGCAEPRARHQRPEQGAPQRASRERPDQPTREQLASVDIGVEPEASAAEATMGPKVLATTKVKASTAATDAQGRRPRAARHCSVWQPATERCAWMIELMSMAPISTTPKTMT